MKTSNKLLIGLFTFVFLAVVGSVFTLKAQYDKIDKNDPFLGYNRHNLKPFRYLKLRGFPLGYVQIKSDASYGIMFRQQQFFQKEISSLWKIEGDTLVVENAAKVPNNLYDNFFNDSPAFYVTAPALSGITSIGSSIKVSDWPGGVFNISLTDAGMFLTKNRFDNLSIKASSKVYVRIEDREMIKSARLTMVGATNLTINGEVITRSSGDSMMIVFEKPTDKNSFRLPK
ncbi:hypothetical protein [Dyadobacter psychrotolerans]|uniref:Uncharacterized protein n=1 Tax=Dyadobacter psychrotolerans TaxID=2541721 RepID=A0A4R5DQ78_9BACT|nr:hypothetical protein [Dyadobacter psychrotolerans]TDE16409.1 hypothetical protein E0F88_09210 [Dyadobacter psychrotolerans]